MSPLTIKDTKFEVRIQDPMKHSCKTKKAKKSSRMSSRRGKNCNINKRHEKRQTKKRVKKSSKSKKLNTPPEINSP
jgi:hypothetical protein